MLLLSSQIVANAEENKLQINFIGNASVRISDGQYTLFTDFPYKSGAYGYMEYDFYFPAVTGNIVTLITHRHEDHFDPFLFEEQDHWKIIAPSEITVALSRSKIIEFSENIRFGPIKVMPKKSKHANTEHYSYLVEWSGIRVFFTGDTEDLELLKKLPELDALFITPWFHRKAILNKALPDVKKIIIYHHTEKEIIPDCNNCIIPVQYQEIEIQKTE